MVSAIIFAAHLLFMLIIFTKKWQDESLGSGFTNLALIVILFTVGWSIASAAAKLVFEQKGFGLYFNIDDISLTMVLIVEILFYRVYYGDDKKTTEDDKEKLSQQSDQSV